MKLNFSAFSPDAVYSSALEAGDYVPHFYVDNDGRRLDLQVKAGEPLLLVFISPWIEQALLRQWLDLDYAYPVTFITSLNPGVSDPRLFWDAALYRLFMQEDLEAGVFLCTANLKLRYTACGSDLAALLLKVPRPEVPGKQLPAAGLPAADQSCVIQELPPPVLIVPDVITGQMAKQLMQYFDTHQNTAQVNEGDYKSRQHLHPSRELELALDDKLSKSLLPEIRKVFFADITYRETYKICCYDADAKGAFGKHRDTIDPHLHRRYAMTLLLNDDYEGGGISFPEYSQQLIQAPKYSALIFPGSLYHQVKQIQKGQRKVIVSFFFTEAEARHKEGVQRYRFRVQRDICNLQINQLWPESD